MCICNMCDSHNVITSSELEKGTYRNSTYDVHIDYSVCSSCGEEFITKDQITKNEVRIREAKKKIDGFLSADEIYQIRTQLNLTQAVAAVIFGGGKNAFSKYERSEVTQSFAMDKLLRLVAEDAYIFKKLIKQADMEGNYNFNAPVILDNVSIRSGLKPKPLRMYGQAANGSIYNQSLENINSLVEEFA